MERRRFLKNTVISAAGTTIFPWNDLLLNPELVTITILHTNDVHSRIEPFPMDGSRNAGKGGAVGRAMMIDKIRKVQEHVLLLDAGDIFQGTPYFNFFYGELEMKLMTEMGYNAATIGNHDFDGGIENLAFQLQKVGFKMLNSNYIVEDTPLAGLVEPFQIYELGGVKIGVYALGIALNGLVPRELTGNTVYTDPMAAARKQELFLKKEMKCDYIICLSHLGYKYGGERISDIKIAEGTDETDLIIGGHTHTFLTAPEIYTNAKGNQVMVNQVGWAGLMLGRIDITFEKNKKSKCVNCKNIVLEQRS